MSVSAALVPLVNESEGRSAIESSTPLSSLILNHNECLTRVQPYLQIAFFGFLNHMNVSKICRQPLPVAGG
jgi:hypothetical protein